MIKKRSATTAISMLIAIICLLSTFPATALAAAVTGTVTVPAGQSDFSIRLNVNETEPYAGIEFALTISGGAVTFVSFIPGLSGASPSPFVKRDGKHYFGYLTDSNAFPSGDMMAGTLNFTGYTGSQTLTITITQMKVIRLGDNKKSVISEKESPAYIFTVERAAGGESQYTDNPNDENKLAGDLGSQGQTPDSPGQTAGNPGSDIITDVIMPLSGGFPFDDMHEGDWFYNDVVYVYESGLMNGTGAATFSPNASLTRGMIVTILGRQAGVDESEYPSCSFSDVDNKKYYAPYIEWGRQNSVILGVGENSFEPDRPVTRQELAAILHRYADFAGFVLPVKQPYAQFLDDNDIADYAKTPVQALFSAGVIGGRPGNLFDPKGIATRAETATMLHRFLV